MNTGLSQAGQEQFVMSVLKNKRDGLFLEIGSEHPVLNNNTFYLERFLGWNGVMFEYDKRWEEFYKVWRTSKYVIGDAVVNDYLTICKNLIENKYNIMWSECLKPHYNIIDYLQIDLEVSNGSTIKTLENFDKNVFDTFKFNVITFEHDVYNGWCGDDTRRRSREIFERRGYFRVFSDVKHNQNDSWCVPFEDWYVNPEQVDMKYIGAINRNESLNHDEILKLLSIYK